MQSLLVFAMVPNFNFDSRAWHAPACREPYCVQSVNCRVKWCVCLFRWPLPNSQAPGASRPSQVILDQVATETVATIEDIASHANQQALSVVGAALDTALADVAVAGLRAAVADTATPSPRAEAMLRVGIPVLLEVLQEMLNATLFEGMLWELLPVLAPLSGNFTSQVRGLCSVVSHLNAQANAPSGPPRDSPDLPPAPVQ